MANKLKHKVQYNDCQIEIFVIPTAYISSFFNFCVFYCWHKNEPALQRQPMNERKQKYTELN